MFRKYLLPALLFSLAAALCLFFGTGGCRDRRAAEAAPAADESAPATVDDGGGVIGRLEQPATVRATLYTAEGKVIEETDARLAPGVWLVPGSAFRGPPLCATEDRP